MSKRKHNIYTPEFKEETVKLVSNSDESTAGFVQQPVQIVARFTITI